MVSHILGVEAPAVARGVGDDEAEAVGGLPVELQRGVEPPEQVFGYVSAARRFHPRQPRHRLKKKTIGDTEMTIVDRRGRLDKEVERKKNTARRKEQGIEKQGAPMKFNHCVNFRRMQKKRKKERIPKTTLPTKRRWRTETKRQFGPRRGRSCGDPCLGNTPPQTWGGGKEQERV